MIYSHILRNIIKHYENYIYSNSYSNNVSKSISYSLTGYSTISCTSTSNINKTYCVSIIYNKTLIEKDIEDILS
jgi:hypothetical protein